MKKKVIITIIVVAVLIATMMISAKTYPRKFDEELVGTTKKVEWTELNVRESPASAKEPLTQLVKGDKVSLTGYTCHLLVGDDKLIADWTEVQLSDGTIGWVASQALKKS